MSNVKVNGGETIMRAIAAALVAGALLAPTASGHGQGTNVR